MSAVTSWKAGFSARNMNPTIGTKQSGFVIRQQAFTGIHDPLFARALALNHGLTTCCLVIFDLIGVDLTLTHEIRREAAKQADIPEAHIAVLATHTHGGPAILPRAHLGPVDTAFRACVVREGAAAVIKAVATLQPGELHVGAGNEATIAHNRRDPTGPVDPAVPIMRFDRDGKPAALLASYACHPVTLGPDNLQITRDYPGEIVATLERLYPGSFVAFATGCCGQINTGHHADDSLRQGGTSMRSFEEARRIGRTLAEVAARAAEHASSSSSLAGPLRVARVALRLPIMPPPKTTEAQLNGWRRELARNAGCDLAREAILRALISWADTTHLPPRDIEVEVMCIGLGEACIAIYPGEVFVEFGLELKAAFPDQLVVTLGYGNTAPGYLPHRSAYPEGGYEVTQAYRYYGQPGPFPPEAGERVQEEMLRLTREVLS